MSVPEGYRFMESHEWATTDGDLVAVGITAHAVEQLGDLTFVDLPAVGDEVVQGEQFGEIESVKAVSDLIAPCSGTVAAINAGLSDDLGPVASDPFSTADGGGWMLKIAPSDLSELDGLLDPAAYKQHAAEGH